MAQSPHQEMKDEPTGSRVKTSEEEKWEKEDRRGTNGGVRGNNTTVST